MTALNRRTLLAGAAALPAASLPLSGARAQPAAPGPSASVLSNPPRTFGPGAPPDIYPDPDLVVVDRSFNDLVTTHGAIKRLGTGYEWAEGPAWSAVGQYVLFSDVMGEVQYRYIWGSDMVLPFRRPSYNSNGNSFDFQGRHLSTQDFFRRVVRWEHDGTMTVIADSFEGKPLNSPNDLVPHPDGSIWFTDPQYGARLSEGHVDDGEGPMNPGGVRNPRVGAGGTGLIGGLKQVLPTQIYRWDPAGRLDVVATGGTPNGLAFSPDYRKLYFVWNGMLSQADVQGRRLANIRLFTDCVVDGVRTGSDGLRVDTAGNVWSSANGPLGYCGVTCWNPEGKLIGRIRLPEICANLCFCGPKRDYLFMTASQSVYMLRVNIQGAAPG